MLNLCTNNVSASRFAKCTVQSVDANVEKGPALDTAGNTMRGAVYSQTKTVRHGMRAAIVVVATVRCGRGRVDSVRRGETNACAAARDTTRSRRAILLRLSWRDVSMCCLDTTCGALRRASLQAAIRECQCSE